MSILKGFGYKFRQFIITRFLLKPRLYCDVWKWERELKRFIQVPAKMWVTRISLIVNNCEHFMLSFHAETLHMLFSFNILFRPTIDWDSLPMIWRSFPECRLSAWAKHWNIEQESREFMLQTRALSRVTKFVTIGRQFFSLRLCR